MAAAERVALCAGYGNARLGTNGGSGADNAAEAGRRGSAIRDKVSLLDEIKQDNKKVAEWLLYYHERNEIYKKRREQILSENQWQENLGVQKNSISDTTAKKAMELAELEYCARWLQLIRDVEETLPWNMKLFLEVRREAAYNRARRYGRPAWIDYVRREYMWRLATGLGKRPEDVWVGDPSVYSKMWGRIIDCTARKAAKRGLLDERSRGKNAGGGDSQAGF